MRSRYSAFALGETSYLQTTWHPSTRPKMIEFESETQWLGLEILDCLAGGPFDREGVVEFEAFWQQGPVRGSLRERSRFVRLERRWLYLDGVIR